MHLSEKKQPCLRGPRAHFAATGGAKPNSTFQPDLIKTQKAQTYPTLLAGWPLSPAESHAEASDKAVRKCEIADNLREVEHFSVC